MKDLPMPEVSRIAKSVIHKLLIVKMPNGNTVVRIASIIPSAEYARANNYDISKLHPLKLPSDFNGHMSITDWAMGLRKFFKVANGKMVTSLKMFKKGFLPKKRNEESVSGRLVCPPPYDEPNMVWVCVVIPVGDELAPGEGCEPNGSNGYWQQQGTVTVYPECYDDGEDEDGTGDGDLFNCLQTGTPADCYCEFLGIGCEGDGDDPDNPLPEILNEVDDPCLHNLVEQVINADCRIKIVNFINTTFGNPSLIDLRFFDNPFINNATANAHTTAEVLPPPGRIRISITLNNNALSNASSEYIANTIFHETIHAWIAFTFNDLTTEAQEHNMMAVGSRFIMRKDALAAMFPNLSGTQDLEDLCWGGLGDTPAFNALNITDKIRIQETLNRFANRINNTGTPCVP